ncbi:MAG: DUF5011 domain-containing protein [Bacteroidia bacterium]|nr:DUF5011 domain-containing protein [Bacteroidia bacterium]
MNHLYMKQVKIVHLLFIIITFISACRKEDLIPPVIKLNGSESIQLDLYELYIEYGATAEDNKDGDLTDRINLINNININRLGKYQVIYSVTDYSGNTEIKSRSVDVVFRTNTDTISNDTIPPVITLFGPNPMYIKINIEYIEPGAKAMDYVYGDLTPFITIASNINTSVAGSYSVFYSVCDFSENCSEVFRTVIVVIDDNISPVITLIGPNPMYIPLYGQYYEPGATAWDETCGDLTPYISITGNVNTNMSGNYPITYYVEDFSGNFDTKIRIVHVGM